MKRKRTETPDDDVQITSGASSGAAEDADQDDTTKSKRSKTKNSEDLSLIYLFSLTTRHADIFPHHMGFLHCGGYLSVVIIILRAHNFLDIR